MTDAKDRFVWFNGAIVPLSAATVSIMSPTAQFGANVFEGLRCYWNSERKALYGFRFEEHFTRLERSLKMLRLANPYPRERWGSCIAEVVRANGYKEDIAIRQIVFVGGNSGSWFSTEPVGMVLAPIPKSRSELSAQAGVSCGVTSWERISDRTLSPKIKSGANYINSRMGQLEAKSSGYDTAIFLNNHGQVAEGPGACFFMVRDKKLITPPLYASVLESITRDTLLELAKDVLGMQVEERPIDRTELYICDEAFFCGSAAEVTPIVDIDRYSVGSGEMGKITAAVHNAYIKAAAGEVSQYRRWLTEII